MPHHALASLPSTRLGRCFGLICLLALLSGCVANSSNPEIHARWAVMNNDNATIRLQLTNPGGRNLTVQSLQYELSHGEMGFPLATGTWSGALELPAKGEAGLDLMIVFDDQPIEDDSTLLLLNGQLEFKDHTGFLGLSSMDMTGTSFQLEIEAKRGDE
ncbi:MAG: LEA type 2 family protein [Phycisphaerales bacterium]|nr:LEA type 2 family protein [Phycisphaerales bacterium]